ncbi:MAG: heavy metal-associated domain-containing protein, partial [Longimicrobiales bacterium]|nr:heavy metal-associated domain-containing protein [Longimicrobiales bacterium]
MSDGTVTKARPPEGPDTGRGQVAGAKGKPFDRLEIPVTGMTCAACASRVQKGLSKSPGVRDAGVNFATERATVESDP